VGPRVGLEDVEKGKFLTLPGLKPKPLGHPADIHFQYQLHYSSSYLNINNTFCHFKKADNKIKGLFILGFR
jgi:hypothetical protein